MDDIRVAGVIDNVDGDGATLTKARAANDGPVKARDPRQRANDRKRCSVFEQGAAI